MRECAPVGGAGDEAPPVFAGRAAGDEAPPAARAVPPLAQPRLRPTVQVPVRAMIRTKWPLASVPENALLVSTTAVIRDGSAGLTPLTTAVAATSTARSRVTVAGARSRVVARLPLFPARITSSC